MDHPQLPAAPGVGALRETVPARISGTQITPPLHHEAAVFQMARPARSALTDPVRVPSTADPLASCALLHGSPKRTTAARDPGARAPRRSRRAPSSPTER